jgi:hypothetical protein
VTGVVVFTLVVLAGLGWRWSRNRPDAITRYFVKLIHDCPPAVPSPGPYRDPPPPPLTDYELAHLASLATRYSCGDNAAGRQLADYLRSRLPGVGDLTVMRCVVLLSGVARTFARTELTAADAVAAYLHAMSGAALELSSLERQDIPR